ncbi:MAG TPA: PIG-L family deacetylase [Gaiellales bacterium]|nr:PIG-L family deacetylase [Gaiellales bacterium]
MPATETALRFDPAAPELLLSPHWDDAALGCWNLLAGSRAITIVNVFAGLPAPGHVGMWERVSGTRDSRERSERRMGEDRAILAAAGHEPVNLPLLDARYRRGQRIGAEEIDLALASQVQRTARVHAPAGIGGHPDHLLVRSYARVLLRAGIPVELYAEPPYCVFHGWPAWVNGGEAQPNRNVDAHWESYLADVPEMSSLREARIEHVDGAAASAKLEAINRYELSLNLATRRLLSEPEFHRLEVHWELRKPAQDDR